jgi:hypothetical protein
MAENFARLILGLLIMKPELLKLELADDGLFLSGVERTVFAAITKLAEDLAPEAELDINIMAAECKDLPANYISGLLDGLPKTQANEQTFRLYVERQRRLLAVQRLHRAMSKVDAELMKTGDADIGPAIMALDELRRIEAASLGPCVLSLADVEAKPIFWLWDGRLPLGMLTLLAGKPGSGKSFLTLAVAAKFSRGQSLPGSNGAAITCSSLLLNNEDPVAEAIRPRADALGADLSRLQVIDSSGDFSEVLARLRLGLHQHPDVKLVVLDPLNSMLAARANWFADPDVRRELLQPLIGLAKEYNVAILAVVHLTKADDQKQSLNRIPGSLAYGAAARSVLVLGHDLADITGERRLLASAKMNYAPPPDAIAFRINNGGLTFEPITVPNITGDDVLAQQQDDKAERSFVDSWLLDALANGSVEVKSLLRDAKQVSIPRRTLYNAKVRLGVQTHIEGFGQFKTSTWELSEPKGKASR